MEVIKTMLKEKTLEAKDGDEIDRIFRRSLNTSAFPNFTRISDMYTHDYYGFMGGTQTIKVDLEVKQIGDVSYSVKTRMYIGDWYGADYDDIKGGDISPHFNNTGTHLLDIDDIVFQTGFGTALTVADIWKKRKEI